MEPLKTKKKVLKTALTRLRDKVALAIKDADSIALRLFESKTCDLFNDFKLLFDSIFVTCKPEELDDFIKEKETIDDSIDELRLNDNRKMNKTDPEHSVSSVSNCNASFLSDVKLPTLSVPTFNGKIENWIMFKDMFVTSVIDNKSISNSMKLQYLKASCRDEALRVIQSISISDANFDIAWKLLEDSDIGNDIKKFWQLESIGIKDDPSYNEVDQTSETYEKTVCYKDNRYEVELPWKRDWHELNDNYSVAEKRLHSLVRRFKENPDLNLQYRETLHDYEKNGIIRHDTFPLFRH
ncbi:hypothetical protein AVEN_172279-1 [Araneus ventricosus]|uniref:Uncharacterized protein n=1 Tax=Araneus ventricosus TaxID=182803 RepID=A0A4Y2QGH1_ARAVE|nr:hypothetical protein AVEN_172279-1 [Araneus ventricosus]